MKITFWASLLELEVGSGDASWAPRMKHCLLEPQFLNAVWCYSSELKPVVMPWFFSVLSCVLKLSVYHWIVLRASPFHLPSRFFRGESSGILAHQYGRILSYCSSWWFQSLGSVFNYHRAVSVGQMIPHLVVCVYLSSEGSSSSECCEQGSGIGRNLEIEHRILN